MKKNVLLFIGFLILVGGTSRSFSHTTNPILQATMKGLSQDVQTIEVPTKKPTAGDVTDGMILAGIVRARTAQSALQMVIDRKDGEMLPAFIEELSKKEPEKAKALLQQYAGYLDKAKMKLVEAEKQLQIQLAEFDEEKRDFAPLRDILAKLDALVVEAHKVFHP